MTHSLATVAASPTDRFEVAYKWPGGSGVNFFDGLAEVVAHVRGFRLTTITGITLGNVDAYEVVMATAYAKELPEEPVSPEAAMIELIDGDRCRDEKCGAHGPHERDGEERWCTRCGKIWICCD